MARWFVLSIAAAAALAVAGCGGGGGRDWDENASSRVRWTKPYDGETLVDRDRNVSFALTATPRLLTAGLFYWYEDTDDDGRIDYPNEVEGVETTFHYDDVAKQGTIETMYRMYADTVYLVILEVNGDDYSLNFTTESEGRTRGDRPHSPIGIDLDPHGLKAQPKILHVLAP
jgi:hypothetical protein